MIDPKAPDHSYFEWPDKDEFGFSIEEWQKANPPINEVRAKDGLPPYDKE